MSPVPDLVTNVPDSGSVTTSAKSGSPPTTDKDPPASVEPSVDGKSSLPPATTKPGTTPSQPTPARAPSVANEASAKNRSSREEKARKKDDKSVDHVLRALNSLNTTEEKLAAMCKKYADLFDEHRKLQVSGKLK